MKKFLFFAVVIFVLLILIGAGCVSFEVEDREKAVNEGPTVLPEVNVNEEVAPEEVVNAPTEPTAGWEVYRDEPWAIEMKYPPKYKTVFDTYGWPHALIHFIEKAGAQSYRAHIETWDKEGDFQAVYGRGPAFIARHPNGKNYITVDYNSDPNNPAVDEEWKLIISTFRFTAP